MNDSTKTKQFCDCYDHDYRAAIRKLAQIVDMQHINDSIKETATMYLKTDHEINVQKYIRHLEEQIDHAKLSGGVIQALAERQRILGILIAYFDEEMESNRGSRLTYEQLANDKQRLIDKIKI